MTAMLEKYHIDPRYFEAARRLMITQNLGCAIGAYSKLPGTIRLFEDIINDWADKSLGECYKYFLSKGNMQSASYFANMWRRGGTTGTVTWGQHGDKVDPDIAGLIQKKFRFELAH